MAKSAADKAPIVIYRAWCPDAGQSISLGYTDVGALDPPAAARIHAERMSDYQWKTANRSLGKDKCIYVNVCRTDGDAIDGCTIAPFTVRRRMQPIYEVVS